MHSAGPRSNADGIGALVTKPAAIGTIPGLEQYFTPAEIAEAWHVDANTVRRLFSDRVGVLKLAMPRRGKRQYTTLRIPVAVVEQVIKERSR